MQIVNYDILFARHLISQVFVLFSANMSAALLRGYVTLDGGWIAPFNGYQYKATTTYQSWNASRSVCQEEGGDLAQYGVRDVAIRM